MPSLFGLLNQQDVTTGGSTYPTVINITTQIWSSNVTAHAVPMPASTTAGNLLLMLWSNDATTTITVPGTWTAIYNTTNGMRGACLARVSDGTEGGTTVSVPTASTEQAASQVYQISNWWGTIATGIASATTPQTNVAPAPPSLTSGFGIVPTLWIVVKHSDNTTNTTGYPANYTDGLATKSGTTTSAGQVYSARRELTAASESGGTFSPTEIGDCIATRIAIRGTS
jgi:hypothetical protein